MEGRFGTFRSAVDTIIVSHTKYMKKNYFFHRLYQPGRGYIYTIYPGLLIPGYTAVYLNM
jgi:hypothetical protein